MNHATMQAPRASASYFHAADSFSHSMAEVVAAKRPGLILQSKGMDSHRETLGKHGIFQDFIYRDGKMSLGGQVRSFSSFTMRTLFFNSLPKSRS